MRDRTDSNYAMRSRTHLFRFQQKKLVLLKLPATLVEFLPGISPTYLGV